MFSRLWDVHTDVKVARWFDSAECGELKRKEMKEREEKKEKREGQRKG